MFYSHEVLTSRKYGVATIWLVATLGSKSSSKKVTKKAILDVDISKACETIAEPTAPMALRLQSSLLYGVTRVFNQQCGYVLADVECARNDMRVLTKMLRTSALVSEGGNKGRAGDLVLHDDPNFLPEIDFNISDLNIFDDGLPDFDQDSNTTLLLSSNRDSLAKSVNPKGSSIALDLPSLRDPSVPRSLPSSRLQRSLGATGTHNGLESPLMLEFEGLQDDLGLDLDNLGTYSLARSPRQVEDGRVNDATPRAMSAIGMEVPVVSTEHDVIMHDNDAAGAFDGADWQTSAWMRDATPFDLEPSHVTTTSSSASAPLQRHRAPVRRILMQDRDTELRNQKMKEWTHNYVELMDDQRRHKLTAIARSLAKDNARFWFYGSTDPGIDPLSDFQNAALLRRLAQANLAVSPKRMRDDDDLVDNERHVRSRQATEEVALNHDDYTMQDFGDVELGRDQPTPLADPRQSATLPWSQSIGSKRPTPSLMFRMSSSAGGHSRQASLQPRTTHRLPSASPLHDHASNRAGSIPHRTQASDGAAADVADFEAFGPAGQVDTQTAAESQWLRSTLDDESMNFLAFLADAMNGDDEASDRLDARPARTSIGFATLLLPAQHTAIVASQAFLHVLTLSSRGYLRAEQDKASSDIQLLIV